MRARTANRHTRLAPLDLQVIVLHTVFEHQQAMTAVSLQDFIHGNTPALRGMVRTYLLRIWNGT